MMTIHLLYLKFFEILVPYVQAKVRMTNLVEKQLEFNGAKQNYSNGKSHVSILSIHITAESFRKRRYRIFKPFLGQHWFHCSIHYNNNNNHHHFLQRVWLAIYLCVILPVDEFFELIYTTTRHGAFKIIV